MQTAFTSLILVAMYQAVDFQFFKLNFFSRNLSTDNTFDRMRWLFETHGYNGARGLVLFIVRINENVNPTLTPDAKIQFFGMEAIWDVASDAIPDHTLNLSPFIAYWKRGGGDSRKMRELMLQDHITHIALNRQSYLTRISHSDDKLESMFSSTYYLEKFMKEQTTALFSAGWW